MGIDYYNYLGAFLKLKKKKQITQVDISSCINNKCKVFMEVVKTEFCSSCGNKIAEQTIDEEKTLSFSHWVSQTEHDVDKLCRTEYPNSKEEEYLFPNFGDDLEEVSIRIPNSESNELILEINKIIDPDEYIKKFKCLFCDILTDLKASGFKYEVVFGFVARAS